MKCVVFLLSLTVFVGILTMIAVGNVTYYMLPTESNNINASAECTKQDSISTNDMANSI